MAWNFTNESEEDLKRKFEYQEASYMPYEKFAKLVAKHVAELVRADEREACAEICDGISEDYKTRTDLNKTQQQVGQLAAEVCGVRIRKGVYIAPPKKRSFSEDVGRLLSTGKGFYDDGTPIDPKEINIKIEGVGDGVVTCTEVHLPRPPKKEWVGLTKEEAREISLANRPYVIDMIAALEAKLKEKNT